MFYNLRNTIEDKCIHCFFFLILKEQIHVLSRQRSICLTCAAILQVAVRWLYLANVVEWCIQHENESLAVLSIYFMTWKQRKAKRFHSYQRIASNHSYFWFVVCTVYILSSSIFKKKPILFCYSITSLLQMLLIRCLLPESNIWFNFYVIFYNSQSLSNF